MDQDQFAPSDDYFPYKEMLVLASAVFASAISLSGLFPYVGFMVIQLGEAKDENDAGFASGYIASAMMLGRLFSSIAWGRAADSIGRKPLLLLGCFSVGTFSLLFGFSSNFIMALIARFLLGFFNPIW